jgi:phospholipid/cholesterol/gamma-HCH transport system permease protein
MNVLDAIGRVFLRVFEQTGLWFDALWRTITWAFRPPYDVAEWFRQMVRLGVNSIPIVFLSTMFTGMVMGLQVYNGFQRVHAEQFVGSVVALAMLRELSPVLVGLMVTGRVGSSMAAEIGTMRVTEQIDALETLAYDPIAYLVVPRLIAALIMVPALTIIADAVGVGTAMLTAVTATDVTAAAFTEGLRLSFTPFQIVYSVIKAVLFGGAIAFFCTYEGYTADVGAEGVGRSTAQAVVVTSVAILVLDAITALLLAPYLQA